MDDWAENQDSAGAADLTSLLVSESSCFRSTSGHLCGGHQWSAELNI